LDIINKDAAGSFNSYACCVLGKRGQIQRINPQEPPETATELLKTETAVPPASAVSVTLPPSPSAKKDKL